MIARGLAVAAIAAVAYAWLGDAVAHRPPEALWPIDAAAGALAGHATHVALLFTASCWWYVLVALGVAALALGWLRPDWRARTTFSVVVTLIAWKTSDLLKDVFARTRPAHWFLHHETTYAYSSGHATFAVVVYALWSYLIAASALPRTARIAGATLLAAWACAVVWSRLALGAHWATDLIGGILLGVAMLGLGAAVAAAWPRRSRVRV